MTDDTKPVQADGKGSKSATPPPQGRTGGGESGGGAYKQADVETGDNTIRKRPVETGRKSADEKAPDEDS